MKKINNIFPWQVFYLWQYEKLSTCLIETYVSQNGISIQGHINFNDTTGESPIDHSVVGYTCASFGTPVNLPKQCISCKSVEALGKGNVPQWSYIKKLNDTYLDLINKDKEKKKY